jgi:hypothetical protein
MLEIGDKVYGLVLDPYTNKNKIVDGYIKTIDTSEEMELYACELILIKFKDHIKNSIPISAGNIKLILKGIDTEIDFDQAESICGKLINRKFMTIDERGPAIPAELVSKDYNEIDMYHKFSEKFWYNIYNISIKEYIKQELR